MGFEPMIQSSCMLIQQINALSHSAIPPYITNSNIWIEQTIWLKTGTNPSLAIVWAQSFHLKRSCKSCSFSYNRYPTLFWYPPHLVNQAYHDTDVIHPLYIISFTCLMSSAYLLPFLYLLLTRESAQPILSGSTFLFLYEIQDQTIALPIQLAILHHLLTGKIDLYHRSNKIRTFTTGPNQWATLQELSD